MSDNGSLIYNVILLVALVAAFFTYRVSLKDSLKMIAAWVGIFAFFLIVFSFRSEFLTVWERVKTELVGRSNQTIVGQELVLQKSIDGHFFVNAQVNGKDVEFMVDSGATTTSLSASTAEAIGLSVDRGYPVVVSTANGNAKAWRASIDTLKMGNLTTKDHPVLVLDGMLNGNLLGMNFLSDLKSWRVEGDKMILIPHGVLE